MAGANNTTFCNVRRTVRGNLVRGWCIFTALQRACPYSVIPNWRFFQNLFKDGLMENVFSTALQRPCPYSVYPNWRFFQNLFKDGLMRNVEIKWAGNDQFVKCYLF